MQNFCPDEMKLNKFQHFELPPNSRMFLRVENANIHSSQTQVEVADFTSRKTEKLVREEQEFLRDYQSEMNRLDAEEAAKRQSESGSTDDE